MFSTKKISAKGKPAPKAAPKRPVKKAPVKKAAPARKPAPKSVKKAAPAKRSGGGKTTGPWLGSSSGAIGLDKWYGECLLSRSCW